MSDIRAGKRKRGVCQACWHEGALTASGYPYAHITADGKSCPGQWHPAIPDSRDAP